MIITHNYTCSKVDLTVPEALELIRQLAGAIKLADIRNAGTSSFSESATVRSKKNTQPEVEDDPCGVITFEVRTRR